MRYSKAALALVPLAVALVGAAPSGPSATFLEAWEKIPSYTCSIRVHETKGTDVQDRTYRYAYRKPHFAKIDITGGPGRGGGAVWRGGDTITGHRGGMVSFIRLSKPIHDPEAVDLRGGTIAEASFQNMADAIKAAPSLTAGEDSLNGNAVDTVTFAYTDANGATKRTIFLSRTTHLPVRRVTFSGESVVEDEYFTEVNAEANLKESDF